ncbi:hypothetical protein BCR44DRAFT_42359 [Catenaria anguillulae PL171]|uniref:Uncharacterized protein n=1 Tax=Catenaria anguillulae PL171 TaxID=765915 RepID=A0A1Y2HLG8_9FUNG|nr:hypothetical protein BCR44DRAFT_42359 [Catenaria anguillulae PL171]
MSSQPMPHIAADSTELLDWWLEHCGAEKLKYMMELAMDHASCHGRVDTFSIGGSSISDNLQLKYSSQALDLVAETRSGELKVLEWWVASGLELQDSHTDGVRNPWKPSGSDVLVVGP